MQQSSKAVGESTAYDAPPAAGDKKKKIRIRVVPRDPSIVMKDILQEKRDGMCIKDILKTVNETLKKSSLPVFEDAALKISADNDCHYKQITSDKEFREHINSAKNPFVAVYESAEPLSYLRAESLVDAISQKSLRTKALALIKDKGRSERVPTVLKSKKFTKPYRKLVKAVLLKVEEMVTESRFDVDDDDDDDDDDGYFGPPVRRRGGGGGGGESDSDSDDSPLVIRRDDSSSEEEGDDESGLSSAAINSKVSRVVDATSNALSRQGAYELLKTHGFDVDRAMSAFFDGPTLKKN